MSNHRQTIERTGHQPAPPARTSAILLSAAVVILAAACGTDRVTESRCGDGVQRDSEFFDYRTGSCVAPTSDEDAQRLFLYGQLRRATATTSSPIDAVIEFQTPARIEEVTRLLSTLPPDTAVSSATIVLPDILGGVTIPTPTSAAGTAPNRLAATLPDDVLARIDYLDSESLRSARGDIAIALDNSLFAVTRLTLRCRSSALEALWAGNDSLIREIVPRTPAPPWTPDGVGE